MKEEVKPPKFQVMKTKRKTTNVDEEIDQILQSLKKRDVTKRI